MRYVEVTTPKLLASRCGSRDASWCSAIERALGQGSGGADRRHPADGRASRKATENSDLIKFDLLEFGKRAILG
jgi:hypothetical protein